MNKPSSPDWNGRLSINQASFRNSVLPVFLHEVARAGITNVALWRDSVREFGVGETKRLLEKLNLHLTSYTTGGFRIAPVGVSRPRELSELRKAISEASSLGAPCVIVRGGGLPDSVTSLAAAINGVEASLIELANDAEKSKLVLAIEPLHPMFAADRGVITTLRRTVEIVEKISSPFVGIALDSYNSWWDPELEGMILRAGSRISVVQLSDWSTNFQPNLLHSRAMLNEGVIDFEYLLKSLSRANYSGPFEVEIFNKSLWDSQLSEGIERIKFEFDRLSQQQIHDFTATPSVIRAHRS